MNREEELLTVARAILKESHTVSASLDGSMATASSSIEGSREILARYGRTPVPPPAPTPLPGGPMVLESFDDILAKAHAQDSTPARIDDLLSAEEMASVGNRLDGMRQEFRKLHQMDAIDYAIAGSAGLLAALVDIFLIQMPKAPGLLGASGTPGGPLSNWIREKVNSSIPPDRLAWLEKEFKVPFDASVSTNLKEKIAGLSPRTHRLHSLGHDPILAWMFGVGDIMGAKMSAIDKHGEFSSQVTGHVDPSELGVSLFTAIYRMLGHLLSDVSTRAGLPVPLSALFLKAQQKLAVLDDRSAGEIARIMYVKNYDFRHFLSMSVSPLLIEAIVRIGYLWKELAAGKDWKDALPVQSSVGPRKPRLQSMLFTAHSIAAAANAGKIAVQGGLTPVGLLALNYPQWVALGRYSVSQAVWLMHTKPKEEIAIVQKALDDEWEAFFNETDNLFARSTGAAFDLGSK